MTELPPAGWYRDPSDSALQRFWTGAEWTEQVRAADPDSRTDASGTSPKVASTADVSQRARQILYWSLVGVWWAIIKVTTRWTWAFTKWTGRMFLWLFLWPLGLFSSLRHGSKKRNKKLLKEMQRSQR